MKKTIPILLALLTAAVSCSREDTAGGRKQDAAEQQVEVTLKTSQTSGTRAPIGEENVVGSLDLLVFKADKFLYWRSAYKVNDKFRATLTIDTGLDVYFLANARELLTALDDDSGLTEGMSWENMRMELVDNDPSKFNYTSAAQIRLPMWGVLNNRSVEDVPLNHWGTLDLLRSVASVDVEISNEVADATFTLEEMRLYFVPDKGLLAPASSDPEAIIPESPPGMQTTLMLQSSAYDATGKSIANKLYLYENDTDESNRTLLPNKTRRYTRLVIGGTYLGTKYYYPIDFETDDDQPDRITRNWKYVFRINSVTSRGYTDPETASTEPAVGLNVSIIKWNEKTEDDFYTSGPYYVGITGGRDVVLQRKAGSARTIGLRSNIKADLIGLNFAEDSVNGNLETIADGIRNERFQVTETVDSEGYITGLVFTALQDYDAVDDTKNHDVLTVTSGRIQFDISITQVGESDNDWEEGGSEEVDLE